MKNILLFGLFLLLLLMGVLLDIHYMLFIVNNLLANHVLIAVQYCCDDSTTGSDSVCRTVVCIS